MPPDDAIDVVQAYIFGRDKTPDFPYTFGTSWSLDPDSKSIMKAIFHYNEKANKERDNTIFITFDQVNKPPTSKDIHKLLDEFFITDTIAPYQLKCQDVD